MNETIQQYSTPQCDSVTLIAVESAMPREPLNRAHNTGLSLLFLAFFIFVFALLKLRGNHVLPNAIAFYSNRNQLKQIQDEGIRANSLSYMLGILLSSSILAVIFIFGFHQTWDIENLGITLGYIVGWHIFSLLVLCICRWIFDAHQAGYESIATLWMQNILIGICAAPLVLSMLFIENAATHYALNIIFLYLLIFYIIKIYRWIKIISTYRISILYLILYLCTLEVIPLLFIYKALV